jgi:hypothetical protein
MVSKITLEEGDYAKAAYLARRLVPKEIIARRLGFRDHSGLIKRAKKDKRLSEALDGSYDEAKIGLYISQYRQAIDHHYTMCRVCHKISDGEFYESCPYCDEEFALSEGYASLEEYKREHPDFNGVHNKVRHRLEKADTAILIHMGKHHLGQTDKSLVEIHGNKNHPLAIENLTEEQIDKKLEKLLPILQKEYGSKKPTDGPNIAPET